MGLSDLKARMRDKVEDLRTDMSNLKVRLASCSSDYASIALAGDKAQADAADASGLHGESECVATISTSAHRTDKRHDEAHEKERDNAFRTEASA